MSPETGTDILQFEGFRLDSVRRTLHAPDGSPIDLKAKVFDTLLALVRRAGEVVPKSDLLETIWPDVVVEENNLNQAVSALRKALASHAPDNKIIVTVPGRGYQLAAPVTPATADAQPAANLEEAPAQDPAPARPARPVSPEHFDERNFFRRPATWGSLLAMIATVAALIVFMPKGSEPIVRERSIAVLPFENLSADTGQDYFARGVAEETLNLLTQLDGLEVIARNSSFAFGPDADPRIVGGDLGVATVLSGAVRTTDDRVLVSAQLVDGETGHAIWTREYTGERSPEYIFDIQKQIAARVAGALSITFGASQSDALSGRGTRSLEAYDHYLRGMDIWNGRRPGDPQSAFRAALDIDPDYAAAWAGLAIATAGSTWATNGPEAAAALQAEAFEYASHAVELDPDLSLAQSIFGAVSCTQFDWIGAEAALDRSIEIGRNMDAFNHRMMLRLRVGRLSDANRDLIELQAIDPLQTFGTVGHPSIRNALGEHESVLADIRAARAPNEWRANTERLLLMTLIHADAPSAQIREVFESFSARGESGVAQMFTDLLETFDQPDEARTTLATYYDDKTFTHPYKWDLIPVLAAWYEDDDLVLRIWGDELPVNQVRTALIWGPAFSSARARPEFHDLIREIGMDDYWRAVAWADKCRPTSADDFVCE